MNKLKQLSISLVLLSCFTVTSKVRTMNNQIINNNISNLHRPEAEQSPELVKIAYDTAYIKGFLTSIVIIIKDRILKQQFLKQEEQRKMGQNLMDPKANKISNTRLHFTN